MNPAFAFSNALERYVSEGLRAGLPQCCRRRPGQTAHRPIHVRLIGETAILRDTAERLARGADGSDCPPGSLCESIGGRGEAENLSKTATDASRVQPMRVRPRFQAKHGLRAQGLRERVRPVSLSLRLRRKICQQVRQSRSLVALRQTHQGVGIGYPARDASRCSVPEFQHQHLGASPIEPVQMALPCLVKQHIARLHPVASRIASFDVSAGEHHRGKATLMKVTLEVLARRMSRASGGRRADPVPRGEG
jgi:hypothetical protein